VDLDARLTVLGSLNMDISVTVPELPGPGATVLGGGAAFAPGGKGANQAVAAARLGGAAGQAVRMVGCLGDDDFGRALRSALAAEGVDDQAVRTVAGAPTGIAMITVDQAGENIITVAPGANREVGEAEVAAAGAAGVLVISAEIPAEAILAVLTAARSARKTGPAPLTVLNLAPAPPEAGRLVAAGPDWLVVNESEAAAVLGRPVSGLASAASAAADLVAAGARRAVVTAGAAGAAYCLEAGRGGGHERRTNGGETDGEEAAGTVAAFPVTAVDTVGAGDTFVGALAVALAARVPPREAVTAAAAAGAAAAARPGTQAGMPCPADIGALTGYRWPVPAGG
jgi:ribokinase